MYEKCFLYDACNHKDCGKFCVRKYKMDMLYSNSLLTDAQKVHITLKVDEDGTDLEEFKQLAEIEKDIVTLCKMEITYISIQLTAVMVRLLGVFV